MQPASRLEVIGEGIAHLLSSFWLQILMIMIVLVLKLKFSFKVLHIKSWLGLAN